MVLCNTPSAVFATAPTDVFENVVDGVASRPQSAAHHHAIPAELDRLLDRFSDIAATADLEAAWATVSHLRDAADALEAAANRLAVELKAEGTV